MSETKPDKNIEDMEDDPKLAEIKIQADKDAEKLKREREDGLELQPVEKKDDSLTTQEDIDAMEKILAMAKLLNENEKENEKKKRRERAKKEWEQKKAAHEKKKKKRGILDKVFRPFFEFEDDIEDELYSLSFEKYEAKYSNAVERLIAEAVERALDEEEGEETEAPGIVKVAAKWTKDFFRSEKIQKGKFYIGGLGYWTFILIMDVWIHGESFDVKKFVDTIDQAYGTQITHILDEK